MNTSDVSTRSSRLFFALFTLLIAISLTPSIVRAHEVYVLNETTITSDLAVKNINVIDALNNPGAVHTFVLSVVLGVLAVVILAYLIHTKLSKRMDTKFAAIRPYAHLVIRVGLGISFLWGAYHNAIFGPELSLASIPGGLAWKPVLIIIGILLIFGAMTRLAAAAALIAFITVAFHPGNFQAPTYMVNYLNYLAEISVLLLERGTKYSVDQFIKWPSHIFHHRLPVWIDKMEAFGQKYSFTIIRVGFGIALIWAAISIKILHPALSLDVLHNYGLDTKVAFTALFVVFCAGIIEILLGIILITGIMYRPGMVLLIFFISYSVYIFGEEVWPHVILVALGIGLFLHGKDELCLEDKFYNILWGWTRRFRKNKGALTPE